MPRVPEPHNAKRPMRAPRRRDAQLQIWASESRDPAFAAKCRQQARAIAAVDPAGDELMAFVDHLYEWPEG